MKNSLICTLLILMIVLTGCNSQSENKSVINNKDSKKVMNYNDSCKYLQKVGLIEDGDIPPLLDRMPRYDDQEPFGVNFFRTNISNAQLNKLSIPKTYLGLSEVRNVNSVGSDLSESNLCWNNFIKVDFTNANVSKCDMRASIYKGVKFTNADLENADLRHSSFEKCDFTGANMKGVHITKAVGDTLKLTAVQVKDITWEKDDGEEPEGG